MFLRLAPLTSLAFALVFLGSSGCVVDVAGSEESGSEDDGLSRLENDASVVDRNNRDDGSSSRDSAGDRDDSDAGSDAGSRGPGPHDAGDGNAATPDAGAGSDEPPPVDDVDAGVAAPVSLPTGTTWQWQLTDYPVDTSFDVSVYDVDLFEVDDGTLETLRDQGRVIICYFSAGTFEPWRPDVSALPSSVKGASLDPPFGDELWLDHRAASVRALVTSRLDLAVERGCDGVEPDNVDGYDNGGGGLGLDYADQLDFNRFIAAEAHARGLSVGLKNDLEQLDDLVEDFDWALNEECYSYDECDAYEGNFLATGKAVLHAEYVSTSQLGSVCAVTMPLGLSTLIKDIDLDAPALACP